MAVELTDGVDTVTFDVVKDVVPIVIKDLSMSINCSKENTMVKVKTKDGNIDYIKRDMVMHYIITGYVVEWWL